MDLRNPSKRPNGPILWDDNYEVVIMDAYIWCIKCTNLDDPATHAKTLVLAMCDSKTYVPQYIGGKGDEGILKIEKPCSCQPKRSNSPLYQGKLDSPRYIYALTYSDPDSTGSYNFAVDFDEDANTLNVLDPCNFSLNELQHTVGCMFSVEWTPVVRNYTVKNLANLLP
jgi:hypothetical protein